MRVCLGILIQVISMTCVLMSLGAQGAYARVPTKYRVFYGEQLGKILHHYKYTPLWGRNGYVQKTIRMNPRVVSADGEILESGGILRLPKHPFLNQVRGIARAKRRPFKIKPVEIAKPRPQPQVQPRPQPQPLVVLKPAARIKKTKACFSKRAAS